jgi:hypothetical protein
LGTDSNRSSLGPDLDSNDEGDTINGSIDNEVFHSALDMLDEQERAEYDAQVAEAWRIHNKYHPIATK